MQAVLDAIMNKGARYSSVEGFVVSDKVDSALAGGLMCDVLRVPGDHPRKWVDLTVVHEAMEEARTEIKTIRDLLTSIKAV